MEDSEVPTYIYILLFLALISGCMMANGIAENDWRITKTQQQISELNSPRPSYNDNFKPE